MKVLNSDRLDRLAQARWFELQASAAALKGDDAFAERLALQANIYAPAHSSPEERLRALAAARVRQRRAETGTVRRTPRKFDFLYAPTLRGLSTEFSSLAPLHPDVFSVPKHELDHALETATEGALLEKYRRSVLDARPHVTGGLVQHAYIAEQYGDASIAARLAAICNRRLFVHGVRDPLAIAVSTYNHELIARHGGAYRFLAVDEKTGFGRAPLDLDRRWRFRPRTLLGRATRRHAPLPLAAAHRDAILDEALGAPRHYAVGSCYARHFEVWKPLDLTRRPESTRHTVQRLFEAIGVNDALEHPAFHASEGTTVHRLMVQNLMNVQCEGHALSLGLGYANRAIFSNSFLMGELYAFQADDRFAGTELAGLTLALTVPLEQWVLLPAALRLRLIEEGRLLAFCNEVLVPEWLASHAAWQAALSRHLLKHLEAAMVDCLKDRVGRDFEQFLKHHPAFENAWPAAIAALGRHPRQSPITSPRLRPRFAGG
ncbi:MAG: hypothetical protein HY943_12945 [Gammaproteobacteria bacterium]|nr:hypothetical protein [Gammaproteobacteria bacterium]